MSLRKPEETGVMDILGRPSEAAAGHSSHGKEGCIPFVTPSRLNNEAEEALDVDQAILLRNNRLLTRITSCRMQG